jgi:uncharacterized protein
MRSPLILPILTFTLTAGASAQEAADRGALVIHRGTDTVVTDRFIRSSDTLKGVVQIKGQPSIEYRALLGPDETVRSLLMGIVPAGATAPAQRIRISMVGDSVIAEVASGVHRLATKAGAIPMFNNALALSELFTRRAKAAGGVANIPYFATSGGVTIDVAVRPISADSMSVAIANQVQRFKIDARGRILGGVIAGSNLEFGRLGPDAANGLVVQLRDSAIAPKADYSAPAGAPYRADEARVTGPGGIILGGTLTMPTNVRGPVPAVVTITGSGQQDRDEYIPFAGGIRLFRQVADTLSRRGIAVLRLDDRGIGASGGEARDATSADFADDIRAALAYLRTRRDIDGARLALVGHSEGGAIAPMVAATDPKLAAMVVMAGPGEPGIEISMAQNKYILERDTTLSPAKRDSILKAARASLDPARQTIPWVKFWMSYDPAPTARRVKAPTLILQGATDRQVPVDQAEKLAALIRAGGNKDVTVRVIPTTDHLFIEDPAGDFNAYDKLPTNKVSAKVLGPLADWLALKLKAP